MVLAKFLIELFLFTLHLPELLSDIIYRRGEKVEVEITRFSRH